MEMMQGGELTLVRSPEASIAEAQRAAKVLVDVVRRNNWEITIAKRKYMKVEAWETLAHFYGVAAKTSDDRFIDIGGVVGFEATAEATLIKTGQVISSARAMCLNDEDHWSIRPKYEWDQDSGKRVQIGEEQVPLFQLRSMAQTRAIGKVLRNIFAWVVAMAGYAPTPAEEMTGSEDTEGGKKQSPMPQRRSAAVDTRPITGAQASRVWAIAKGNKERVGVTLKAYGFDEVLHITRDKYDDFCKALEGQEKPAGIADIVGAEPGQPLTPAQTEATLQKLGMGSGEVEPPLPLRAR
jgi:hypothetical protein